jgi:hypothetical protein
MPKRCCCGGCFLYFEVLGCGSTRWPLAGALVEIIVGGVTVASGTTDASGHVGIELAGGTYDLRVSKTRFDDYEASDVDLTCQNLADDDPSISYYTVYMAGDGGSNPSLVASGYHCLELDFPYFCADPAPDTLYLTDSWQVPRAPGVYPIALTYAAGFWTGNAVVQAFPPPIMPGQTNTLTYSVKATGGLGQLTIIKNPGSVTIASGASLADADCPPATYLKYTGTPSGYSGSTTIEVTE